MATTTTTMTGAQFDALPYEEGRRWELLAGGLIEMPSPTPRHQEIVVRMALALRRYLEGSGLSVLVFVDIEFALTDHDRLRPDVCVLAGENAARLDQDRTPTPGSPDLAIEVISPSERASESHEKVRTYLRNGTTEVWQIYPKSRTALIHKTDITISIECGQEITTSLLPSFRLELSKLFE